MDFKQKQAYQPINRIRIWYGILLLLGCIFIVRLFYLQVIRNDHYQKAASFSQLKQYEIPASRGVIQAKDGDKSVPLVLNETLYTLFADPKYVKDPVTAAESLQRAVGGNKADYEAKLKKPDSPRYTVLGKRLSRQEHEAVAKLKLKGIGTREAQYRTYPDGQLAAQLLGFVNDDGEGKYGLEQALDKQLKGTPGFLKAITDAAGVPLAANKDNVVAAPKAGQTITLTIDIVLQQQLEEILKQGTEAAKAESASALILDVHTGAVRAMASFPSYSPAEYYKTENAHLFNSMSLSPLEVGSIMKPLTAAAALDQGVINQNSSYFDPSFFRVDDAVVRNVEEDGGAATRNIGDILTLSLNTGATWMLMQMGGGTINEQARVRWHDYMTNHYHFGKTTGIEQGYEAEGFIPSPTDGFGLNITYANTAFGQGMTATPLQMGAAFAAVVNGGTYYKPHLVESSTDSNGNQKKHQPEVVSSSVVKPAVSQQIVEMLTNTYRINRTVYGATQYRSEYLVGGKTGTAEVSKPEGGYYEDVFNGTYLGFVGGDRPDYVIVVRTDKPKIPGYAGAKAAAPIFVKLTDMLINSYGISPKSQ